MHSVIIVDDELFVRKGLAGMIDWESRGFHVIGEADNGEDALMLIREKKPDLVITDIRMPVLDGIELIQTVVHEQLETEFIIISGYNEFHYAQQAMRYGVIDYVLKPIEKDDILKGLTKLREKLVMKNQLQVQKHMQIGEKQIEALIRGEIDEAALSEWRWALTASESNGFTYVLIELNDILPLHDPSLPNKDEIKAAIQKSIRQAASAQLEPIIYEHRRAYGLIVPAYYLSSYRGSIHLFIKAVLLRLIEQFTLEYRIYAGKTVELLKELKLSYSSAKEAVQYKFMKNPNQAIFYDDIAGMELNYLHLNGELYRQVIDAVEETNLNALQLSIDRLFSEFLDRCFSLEAIKTAIVQCVIGIVQSIRSVEGDERELLHIDAIMSWHNFNLTFEGLRQLFVSFAFEAAELIKKLYHANGKGGIHKIKSYVDLNFHENISLKSLAAQFYMNSAYIGQLFKKNYSVYFNDYLQQLRITEAKKLMRQKDLRIYEIAERVGFQNADYFASQFEKLEGITPKEYRNRMNNR